jgi:hypothetical protein
MDHSQYVGPLRRVISPIAKPLPTQTKKAEYMRTDTHISTGSRTYDPEILTSDGISWLRPRHQCDNRILFLQIVL